jgi:fructose-1,6-bisphosphatase I
VGRATDGRGDLLDIEPTSLHQRTPVYIGSAAFVELAQRFVGSSDAAEKVGA